MILIIKLQKKNYRISHVGERLSTAGFSTLKKKTVSCFTILLVLIQ